MKNILNKEHKLEFVKKEYERIINHIYNIQNHIINNADRKNNIDKKKSYINEIIKISNELNNSYYATISNNDVMCDEYFHFLNKNINISKSYNNIVSLYNYNKLMGFNNNNCIIVIFDDIFAMLKELGSKTGFNSFHTAISIIIGNCYEDFFDSELLNKIKKYDKLFIQTSYKFDEFNNEPDFYISKETNKQKYNLMNNCVINICIGMNRYLSFNGYFIIDSTNVLIKSSQFFDNELHNKIIRLKQNIDDLCIDCVFAELFVKNLQYYEYLIYTTDELLNHIKNMYILYTTVIKIPFVELVKKFVESNICEIYNILKVLLIQSNNNLSYILFNLLKSTKSNTSQLVNYVYNNLNHDLQIKLKNASISFKTEIDKFKKQTIGNISYEKQLFVSHMPENVKEIVYDKILELKSSNSENNSKILLYIKTILKYPWPKDSDNTRFIELKKNTTKRREFIENAIKTLNSKIYGHVECKEQINELICKWISNPKCKGTSIGLCGPPGTGKTLIAKALGTALNMPFVQINLGGQNDGDILFGHSYTYNAAQPGMIIRKMTEAGNSRCIFYFDELDKVSVKNGTNEIYNILIHLIDPINNSEFQDKFFQDVSFSLRNVIFIFSYNDSSKIDRVLLDRIKEIEIKPYTINDKINIAKKYMLTEICDNIGFDIKFIDLQDDVIEYIVEYYTSEPGVRNLNRKMEQIVLKLNVDLIYERRMFLINSKINITREIVNVMLNEPDVFIRKIHSCNAIGIVNGLYATNAGKGGLIPIQVYNNFTGTDNKFVLKLTGCLGKVMKESVIYSFTTAMNVLHKDIINSYVKTNTRGLHIHAPDASIKKDGSSAGCAIAVAIISRILNKPIKNEVAMTGEIEPTGHITKIGGLIYKLIGAKNAGVSVVYIPKENEREYLKITKENKKLITKNFEVIVVNHIIEILKNVLIDFSINDFCEFFTI